MPILNFTVADVLKGQNLEGDTWYHWHASKFDMQKNSKGTGFNLFLTFTLQDASDKDLNGKEIRNMFFDQAQLIPLVAAIRGVSINQIPKENFALDTDELMNKPFDGKHILDVYNGQIQPKISEFLPYNSSSNLPAF